jgi:hypothetical protein
MLYFLALAGTAKSVFKTAAFNRSAIPPFTILPDGLLGRAEGCVEESREIRQPVFPSLAYS